MERSRLGIVEKKGGIADLKDEDLALEVRFHGLRGIRRATLVQVLLIVATLLVTGLLGRAMASEPLRATLKNGLRVVIVRNMLAPVVTTEVNYLVGSHEAPPGFPGMAHAQEHMMFRGSPGLSGEQLASLMAAMGGRANAATQQTVTQYFFTVPARLLELVLRIEATRMRDVLDSQTLWEKERGALEQEVAGDMSNPMYLFYRQLLARMFAGTPYAHDALGTRPSFQKTTAAMLKAFYDSWYVPNNAILVIVGDVEPEPTLAMVKRFFGGIPSRPLPPRPKGHLAFLKASTIRLETDFPYGLVAVAYRLPGYASTDFAASQILVDVLDSQRSKLYRLVTEGKALFAGFHQRSFPHVGLGYALGAFPKDRDGTVLVTALKSVVADYVDNGVPADLIEAAKRHEVADSEFRKNSLEGLAAAWSRALAVEERSFPEEDVDAMRKVTVSDVNQVARKYLSNETAIVGLLSPRAAGKPLISKGFRGEETFSPTQTEAVILPAWAQEALPVAEAPPSWVKPTVTVFPNGLRLIVQPETISRTVSLYGRIKNNPALEVPEGQEGVAEVVDELFTYGTISLDRMSFQKAVDAIAAEVKVGRDFSLLVLSDHFERGVQLLAENLLEPALPEKNFRIVQKEAIATVAGQLHSPSYLAKRALLAGLYPKGDPSLRQATPNTVRSLTLKEVQAYYHKTFRPDLTTLVVIGDVTPAQAKQTIGKYFGGWRASGPQPETVLPPVPLNKRSSAEVSDASRVQAQVTLAETLGLTRFHPDYYALQLGLHVLSGGFYATRLYRDLREKAGLVYRIEAFLEADRTRSVLVVVYACDPVNVSKARALVVRDLRAMQIAPIAPAELHQAKTLLLRQIPLSESSLDGIAMGLLDRSIAGLPLDEPVRAGKRYMEITAEEVRAAFARWIRPDDLVQVSLGPGPE